VSVPRREFRPIEVLFLIVFGLVVLGLTVPIVPWVWSGEITWLGLPRSFVWVLSNLGVIFAGLVWLYLTEGDGQGRGD
jgi:hypothetical protein